MGTGASLLKGSIIRTLELGVLVGTAFLLTPCLVHGLGVRTYGIWSLVGVMMGYCGLLEFGMSSATARYMSQALGRQDLAELGRVTSATVLLFSWVAVLAVALAAAAAAACPLFAHDAAEAALLKKLLLIMAAATAAGLLAKPWIGLLMADIRYDLIAGLSVARMLLGGGAVYLCLRAQRGVVAVAAATLAVSLLQSGALYVAARLRFPGLRLSWSGCDGARIGALINYGAKALVCQVGDLLRLRLDPVIIASFLGASLVTTYAVAIRLVEAFTQLVLSSTGMMLPVFSRYEGGGNYAAIRESLLKVTKLSTALAAYIGLSVILYGRAFVARWMGPGFEGSYVVAAILCAGFILELPQSPGVQLLYGLSKHQIYAVLGLWGGALKLVLSLCLLKPLGIYGVALATALELAVFKLFIQPVFICRAVDLPVATYLVRTILATLLKTGAAVAACYLVVGRFAAASYPLLAACVVTQTLLFAPVAYLFILGEPERRSVAGALAGLWSALGHPGLPASVHP